MESSTEILRKLLDERGVEYETADGWWTSWDTAGALDVDAAVYCEDLGSGLEIRWYTITPEQAIAATLGRGECEIETTESWLPAEQYHRCKHCGAFFAVLDASGDIPPCVCPNCGRTVKR